ncbi:MAG TPA: iron-containing alcohol dehydrogenase [Phycisphaerae bacterium]|nr:iron-containing alcohol dehydrogenase [Phycisphaerae bacterium]
MMKETDLKQKASRLLREFKGDAYAFGLGAGGRAAEFAVEFGKSVLLIANPSGWLAPTVEKVAADLATRGAGLAGDRALAGSRPNSPREDIYRIESCILHFRPDCIVAIGGGSTIDAVKAANVLASAGRHSTEIDAYLGAGRVSEALTRTGSRLLPLIAVQTAAGSAAHLTKYANVTDLAAGQKKLIVDQAIVPPRAVFDYAVTASAAASLTADGALDGLAHCVEVFYGIPNEKLGQVQDIVLTAVELLTAHARRAIDDPGDLQAREALGLATDLGGCAIMVGGTGGGHLTSFSLVDVTSHGRACGIMNPYYTVFFAPAIEDRLRPLAGVFARAGLLSGDPSSLSGRDLGLAVAEAMRAFAASIGAPTTLAELDGFTDGHIARALAAAKNPQLESKLRNMPVPLAPSQVDDTMGPILQAAKTGDFSLIKDRA